MAKKTTIRKAATTELTLIIAGLLAVYPWSNFILSTRVSGCRMHSWYSINCNLEKTSNLTVYLLYKDKLPPTVLYHRRLECQVHVEKIFVKWRCQRPEKLGPKCY